MPPTSKRQVFATSLAPRGPGAERLRHPAERIAYPRSGEGGQGLEKAGGWQQCSTLPGPPKLLPTQSSSLHLNGGQMCINIYSELPGNLDEA